MYIPWLTLLQLGSHMMKDVIGIQDTGISLKHYPRHQHQLHKLHTIN
jgi:hypothetical protein